MTYSEKHAAYDEKKLKLEDLFNVIDNALKAYASEIKNFENINTSEKFTFAGDDGKGVPLTLTPTSRAALSSMAEASLDELFLNAKTAANNFDYLP